MSIKKIILFLTVAMLVVSCQKDEELTPSGITDFNGSVSLREVHDLCFTSYNIHGLPTNNGLTSGDLQTICDGLIAIDSDVINLQEVWVVEDKNALVTCLSSAGYIDFHYDFDAGLLTLSKYILKDKQSIAFPVLLAAGTDLFKNKGFISMNIDLEEGCEFNIINTHLQADLDGWGIAIGLVLTPTLGLVRLARTTQLNKIKDFINTLPHCIPTIIGGDFNIDVESSEFDKIIDILPGHPTFILSGDTRLPPTNDGGQTLDYFVLSNYSSYYSNLTNQTIENCIDSYTITRYNLIKIEARLDDLGTSTSFVTDYATMEEAQIGMEAYKADNNSPLTTFQIQVENIEICTQTFKNPSDHNPIETCFTYDCTEQEECNNHTLSGPGNNNTTGLSCASDDDCPPWERCVDGDCIPI